MGREEVDKNLESVAVACVRECQRQGVGIDRLATLLAGYAYAVDNADRLPTEGDMLHLAGAVEPSNGGRYRRTPVTFATGRLPAGPREVPGASARLFAGLGRDTSPADFVRAFLDVHPFTDGNGRTAFVLLNWIGETLADPVALPDFFGESVPGGPPGPP